MNSLSFIEHLLHTEEQGLGLEKPERWENNYREWGLERCWGQPLGDCGHWGESLTLGASQLCPALEFQMSPQPRAWIPRLGSSSDFTLGGRRQWLVVCQLF